MQQPYGVPQHARGGDGLERDVGPPNLRERFGPHLRGLSTLVRNGVFRPMRPDRLAKVAAAFLRWHVTIPAGYAIGTARHPDRAIRTIHFGLGDRTKIDSLEITWPSGQVQKLTDVPLDQIIAVKEGTGIVPHKFPRIASVSPK